MKKYLIPIALILGLYVVGAVATGGGYSPSSFVTKVSQLVNDSGFVTSTVTNGLATEAYAADAANLSNKTAVSLSDFTDDLSYLKPDGSVARTADQNYAGFSATNVASIGFTNDVDFLSGTLGGTTGVYFVSGTNNYWILLSD